MENTEYMRDAQGRLVPRDIVADIDIARDELVREIFTKAEDVQQRIRAFKVSAMADIAAFIELSGEKYGAVLGGTKGNVTLTSYDGSLKIQRAIAESITFDERLQAAKTLIDECIRRWADGANQNILALVDHAFQVDRAGNISTSRVLGLRRLAIEDEDWHQAMQAIADSLQVTGSKAYIRLYRRIGASEQWVALPLDVAGV